MRVALRVGLLSLLATLVLGALGGGALAGNDLFDDGYKDCPASTRLDALTGVRVVRTDKDSELKVEWDTPNPAAWNLGGYTAAITVIVDAAGVDPQEQNLALGASSVLFKGIDTAKKWDVQVAVTDRKYVISDIVEDTFISGVKKPQFSGKFMQGGKEVGDFYYLGFNAFFDNWYVDNNMSKPNNPKFRVGLRHSTADPDDAKFDHFRIRIEDEDGDNVLGFDAATIKDSIYSDRVFVLGSGSTDSLTGQTHKNISNIRKSNRFDPSTPAAHEATSTTTAPIWATEAADGEAENFPTIGAFRRLSYTSLASDKVMAARLYAPVPEAIYDLPNDIFERDGSYTITAWAENKDDEQISPRATITISVQEQHDSAAGTTSYQDSNGTDVSTIVATTVEGDGAVDHRAFAGTIPTTHRIYLETAPATDVPVSPVPTTLWVAEDGTSGEPVGTPTIWMRKADGTFQQVVIQTGGAGARTGTVEVLAYADGVITVGTDVTELKQATGVNHQLMEDAASTHMAMVVGLTIVSE